VEAWAQAASERSSRPSHARACPRAADAPAASVLPLPPGPSRPLRPRRQSLPPTPCPFPLPSPGRLLGGGLRAEASRGTVARSWTPAPPPPTPPPSPGLCPFLPLKGRRGAPRPAPAARRVPVGAVWTAYRRRLGVAEVLAEVGRREAKLRGTQEDPPRSVRRQPPRPLLLRLPGVLVPLETPGRADSEGVLFMLLMPRWKDPVRGMGL